MPRVGHRQGTVEDHSGGEEKERLADVRTDAYPDADRLSRDAACSDRRPCEFKLRSHPRRDYWRSGLRILRSRRVRYDTHVRVCGQAQFERCAFKLDRADNKFACAAVLFHCPAACVKIISSVWGYHTEDIFMLCCIASVNAEACNIECVRDMYIHCGSCAWSIA